MCKKKTKPTKCGLFDSKSQLSTQKHARNDPHAPGYNRQTHTIASNSRPAAPETTPTHPTTGTSNPASGLGNAERHRSTFLTRARAPICPPAGVFNPITTAVNPPPRCGSDPHGHS